MTGSERGNVTLEAIVVLPLLCVLTFGCVLVAATVAKQAMLVGETLTAASRTSYIWNNSYKQWLNGAYVPGQHDPVYWDLFEDYPGSALTQRKLSRMHAYLPSRLDATAYYSNRSLLRTVHIRSGHFVVAASVIEPAQFIRNVDLARHYWPIVRSLMTLQQAEAIIEQFSRRAGYEWSNTGFHSHNEARSYLRKLVGGTETRRSTEQIGKWRLIDALDRDNVAHQAYFGFKSAEREVVEQALKDEELLRNGEVNAVVWHFFRRSRDDSVGLSDRLRTELEIRGIAVVIHEAIQPLE